MILPDPPACITFDPRQSGAAAPSPCISVCQMEAASGLCHGCQRTLDEIASWGSVSETEKRRIWQRINRRRGDPVEGRIDGGTVG